MNFTQSLWILHVVVEVAESNKTDRAVMLQECVFCNNNNNNNNSTEKNTVSQLVVKATLVAPCSSDVHSGCRNQQSLNGVSSPSHVTETRNWCVSGHAAPPLHQHPASFLGSQLGTVGLSFCTTAAPPRINWHNFLYFVFLLLTKEVGGRKREGSINEREQTRNTRNITNNRIPTGAVDGGCLWCESRFWREAVSFIWEELCYFVPTHA